MRKKKNKKIRDITKIVPKMFDALELYKPEPQKVTINYSEKKARVQFKITDEGDDFGRSNKYLEIPRDDNTEMPIIISGSLVDAKKEYWIKDDISWKYPLNKLPSSKIYRIVVHQSIPDLVLQDLVRVQSSVHYDSTDDNIDSYWLVSSIRDLKTVEEMWESLEIERIRLEIQIRMENLFATSLPPSLIQLMKITQNHHNAINSKDRNRIITSAAKLSEMNKKINVMEIMESIVKIFDKSIFSQFLNVSQPYVLGNLEGCDYKFKIPTGMRVETLTNLSLEQPEAEGYLQFNKEQFRVKCTNVVENNDTTKNKRKMRRIKK